MHIPFLLGAAAIFATHALAIPKAEAHAFSQGGNLPEDHVLFAKPELPLLVKRQATATTKALDASCTNAPDSRSCWASGFSIATDFDQKWPNTGVTRKFTLTITNTTCNLDGNGKQGCFLYNNQFPGPLIRANWGDMLEITVVNDLQSNGTSTHWHGIRQLGTCEMDGVSGITECPVAPGHSQLYRFQATQFGTSWYHSHFSTQAANGLLGPLIIDGPSSANWEVDLGPLTLTDYFYASGFDVDEQVKIAANTHAAFPVAENILLNGTNKNVAGTKGAYMAATLKKGKKHLLRLINASADTAFQVSLDNHNLQIISSDFVPVKPISVPSLMINVGQRYEVIINADQTPGNYWFRATALGACASSNKNTAGGLGIFTYGSVKKAVPTTSSTAGSLGCTEPSPLIPWVSNTVGSRDAFIDQAKKFEVQLLVPGVTTNNQNIVTWGINASAIDIQWETPTLSYVMAGNTTFPVTANLVELVNAGVWNFWIIQEADPQLAPIPHPIHLHGHDFYVLGSGAGQFDLIDGPAGLKYDNPTRRDTATLPGNGWLVIAFPSDNPGAWLMHCHIAWHVSQGLGVQFLETVNSIPKASSAYVNQCDAWQGYSSTAIYEKFGSGL